MTVLKSVDLGLKRQPYSGNVSLTIDDNSVTFERSTARRAGWALLSASLFPSWVPLFGFGLKKATPKVADPRIKKPIIWLNSDPRLSQQMTECPLCLRSLSNPPHLTAQPDHHGGG